MKQGKNSVYFFVVICILFQFGCNDTATTSETIDMDTTSVASTTDTYAMPAYDPVMDPLLVGAQMSKELGDTLGVKMYEFTVEPGESWVLHTHPDHTVYIIQGL